MGKAILGKGKLYERCDVAVAQKPRVWCGFVRDVSAREQSTASTRFFWLVEKTGKDRQRIGLQSRRKIPVVNVGSPVVPARHQNYTDNEGSH